jgi:hypothetical protein
MKRNGRYFVYALGFSVLFFGCTKHDSNPVDVYIGNTFAGMYWKNQTQREVYGASAVESIFVSAGDVYFVSGQSYWKNDVETVLPNAILNSIIVSEGDIYATGSYLGNEPNVYVPCYFKNSSVVLLDTLEGSASMTLVSGGDVYVVGDVVDAAHHVAKCWKNGVPLNLPQTSNAFAKSIFLSGNDVYVGGGDKGVNVYWKNGVEIPLTSEVGGTDIVVKGSDLYVFGVFNQQAVYWKNGTMVKLSNRTSTPVAMTVSASGVVYVAGVFIENNTSRGAYWTNGSEIELSNPPTGGSWCSSIFIVEPK